MNNPYILLFETPEKDEVLVNFEEVVRNKFISIKSNKNSILVSVPEKMTAQEIHNQITSKMNTEFAFLVIPLNYFYGRLNTNVWEWLKETFPNRTYNLKSDNN